MRVTLVKYTVITEIVMTFLALALLLLAGVVDVHGAGVFDVSKYGAVGDGKTSDTKAVRAACAALSKAGGGTLLFPSLSHNDGTFFLTGPFNISSNCVMEVEEHVTVMGTSGLDGDWPLVMASTVWPQFGHGSDCDPGSEQCRLMHQAFVFAWDRAGEMSNITIKGPGTIDAHATSDTWWKCAKDLKKPPCNGYSRPHLMMLANVKDVVLQDVTVKNSPDWTLHMVRIFYCFIFYYHFVITGVISSLHALKLNCTYTLRLP